MSFLSSKRPKLNLALQGGGAHGAFTWGVLDAFLEDDAISLSCVTGTSAGAVNGALLVSGLAEDGPLLAREKLAGFWSAASAGRSNDLKDVQEFFMPGLVGLTKLMAPKTLNPLQLDPLSDLLTAWVNFEALTRPSQTHLIIAATDVTTALPKLFRTPTSRSDPGITLDMVRASACLPSIQEAVVIDGRPYWDGGFTANPPLQCLLAEREAAADTVIVQLTPTVSSGNPTSKSAIEDAVSRITFQQPLLRDVQFILDLRNATPRWSFGAATYAKSASAHRFHMIDATPITSKLPGSSKLTPTPELVGQLFAQGKAAAKGWLAQHLNDIGVRETVDLKSHYFSKQQ